ncbi:SEL1-like repeat protein [Devosia sp.]|uniref:SEL1-like repeat protein n=1 Tax=Devosia sp. TaxID=1871048 RepID=UPI0032676372
MLTRVLLVVGVALAMAGGQAEMAYAKEKHKPTAPVEQVAPVQDAALDPHNADDLQEILAQADAAAYPTDGSAPDYETAFRLYSLAEEVENATALNELGLMYDFGDFVAVDDEKAVQYYQRSADAGSIVAKNNLALMYQAGEGVTKDFEQAIYWFHQAADAGYGYSMYQLGSMYFDGRGVAKDSEEAVAWYQKAVDAGEPNAHWSLALSYLYGEGGVRKDTQKSAELAYYALTHGVKVALEQLQRIGSADTSPNFRRSMQQMLLQDGFYVGSIDGSFGPKTMAAVKAAFGTAQ